MYFPEEHAQLNLQLTGEEPHEFASKEVISPAVKDGPAFYSSRNLYRLKGILHPMRKRALPVAHAQERVDGPYPPRTCPGKCKTDQRMAMTKRVGLSKRLEGFRSIPFTLCSMLSQRVRQLVRQMPDKKIADLINLALSEAADGKLDPTFPADAEHPIGSGNASISEAALALGDGQGIQKVAVPAQAPSWGSTL